MPVRFALLLFFAALLAGCQAGGSDHRESDYREQAQDPELLHGAVSHLTDVMVHDIFSPPQASRAYTYASVAAYEALVPSHPEQRTLAGQLNGLTPLPPPDTSVGAYAPTLASLHAFLSVGQAMVFSEGRIEAYRQKVHERLAAEGVPADVLRRSAAYGEAVAAHVLAWADEDQYKETRSGAKFTVTDEPGRWQPTPPAYMDGVNPNWDKLRPFVMDSSSQFMPPRPVPYSMDEGSAFREQAREVYEIVENLTEEQREIAAFWDCNPYVMHTRGHAMFATKQMTPGGHWMSIATIAARQTGADFARAAEAYAQLSIALADGFISAWDEKYRSNLVRPETVINAHLDETWLPVLQTPPFPEYPSAHSVTSAAAATALTDLFGEGFAFRDTSEVSYGLPVRSFGSFEEAAEEAGVSRLYGGIHYRMAAENGLDQGRRLGQFLVQKIETRAALAGGDGTRPPEEATPVRAASSE